MAKYTHYYSKAKGKAHNKEILEKSKTEKALPVLTSTDSYRVKEETLNWSSQGTSIGGEE